MSGISVLCKLFLGFAGKPLGNMPASVSETGRTVLNDASFMRNDLTSKKYSPSFITILVDQTVSTTKCLR